MQQATPKGATMKSIVGSYPYRQDGVDHSPDIDSYAPHHTVEGVQEDLKEPKLKIESDYQVGSMSAPRETGHFSSPPGIS